MRSIRLDLCPSCKQAKTFLGLSLISFSSSGLESRQVYSAQNSTHRQNNAMSYTDRFHPWCIIRCFCCYGLQGDIEQAIDSLQRAIDLDPKCREMAQTDTDFDGIRESDAFQALVES